MQDTCISLDFAFQHFFRRVQTGEKEVGYPRFKGKGWYDSFTFPQYEFGWKLEGERLHPFKIGAVKITLHRPVEGEVKTLTIRRDTLGNWYACFSVERILPILRTHQVQIVKGHHTRRGVLYHISRLPEDRTTGQ